MLAWSGFSDVSIQSYIAKVEWKHVFSYLRLASCDVRNEEGNWIFFEQVIEEKKYSNISW